MSNSIKDRTKRYCGSEEMASERIDKNLDVRIELYTHLAKGDKPKGNRIVNSNAR